MAFSCDTGASLSRRRRQMWPALFVATSASLQSCRRLFERPLREWMNRRFEAYQHQAPRRQETKGWPRESAGEFFKLGMPGEAEGVKLDDGTEAASSVVEG